MHHKKVLLTWRMAKNQIQGGNVTAVAFLTLVIATGLFSVIDNDDEDSLQKTTIRIKIVKICTKKPNKNMKIESENKTKKGYKPLWKESESLNGAQSIGSAIISVGIFS